MSAIDRTKIYKKFKGLWVALLHDEETVVGSGKTLKEALNKARKDGYDSPIMTRMPKNLAPCIGGYYEVLVDSGKSSIKNIVEDFRASNIYSKEFIIDLESGLQKIT